ncbi:SDR family NAD(P)-dependent oxidoreductase [Micromonospora sp. URMC 103]|uniref:SDR family NAD(P)-dependent oxidoreductase n=1 Tax=Micromonospora sp. URMC 103 TaxID=3423406 RepID=UPI003F1C69C4
MIAEDRITAEQQRAELSTRQERAPMQLQNKTALVTGSTSGIGRETALLLAAEGAFVIVSGRNAAKGASTVAAIEAAGGEARFVAADLSDLESVGHLVDAAGEVDILVNNAGAFPFAPTLEQGLETFTTLVDTNLRGTYFLTAALVRKMAAKGTGSIVNITTIAGLSGMAGTSVYGATKAAVDSLTRTWAVEFGRSGVRVNAVAPGHTRTDNVVEMMGDETFEALGARVPLGRLAAAKEIAEAVVFLASPKASYITGATLPVDGGFMALGLE